MKIKRKTIVIITIAVIISLLILEVYLRSYWGFCDSVLMMESKNYEYLAQPNQQRFRFRNHVNYNSFSMRSPEPDSTAYKILGFGDSIINGGVAVDQDSLATVRLSSMLTNGKRNVQVLNIGAGSWGPDNDFAYLKEKGNFNAKLIFLVVSSHDAYDNMDFIKVIDKVIRYESKQYKLAIWELIHKYALPRIMKKISTEEYPVFKKGTAFNSGFKNFYNYCRQNQIPFFIYLHADKTEAELKQYNWQGKEIISFCRENNIECLQDLLFMKDSYYRGVIHMNASGQKQMTDILYPALLNHMPKG